MLAIYAGRVFCETAVATFSFFSCRSTIAASQGEKISSDAAQRSAFPMREGVGWRMGIVVFDVVGGRAKEHASLGGSYYEGLSGTDATRHTIKLSYQLGPPVLVGR